MIKLSQLRGSEVLPVKKELDTYLPITPQEKCVFNYGLNKGNNKAVSTIEQVSVEVDEKEAEIELIQIRYEDKDPFFMYQEGNMSKRKLISVIVKELSCSKQKWLKLEILEPQKG